MAFPSTMPVAALQDVVDALLGKKPLLSVAESVYDLFGWAFKEVLNTPLALAVVGSCCTFVDDDAKAAALATRFPDKDNLVGAAGFSWSVLLPIILELIERLLKK